VATSGSGRSLARTMAICRHCLCTSDPESCIIIHTGARTSIMLYR
jgi:hypothetical protein